MRILAEFSMLFDLDYALLVYLDKLNSPIIDKEKLVKLLKEPDDIYKRLDPNPLSLVLKLEKQNIDSLWKEIITNDFSEVSKHMRVSKVLNILTLANKSIPVTILVDNSLQAEIANSLGFKFTDKFSSEYDVYYNYFMYKIPFALQGKTIYTVNTTFNEHYIGSDNFLLSEPNNIKVLELV